MALALLGLAAEHGYPGAETEYSELLGRVEPVDINDLKEKQKCLLERKTPCN